MKVRPTDHEGNTVNPWDFLCFWALTRGLWYMDSLTFWFHLEVPLKKPSVTDERFSMLSYLSMFSALQRILENLICKQAWEYIHDKADILKNQWRDGRTDLDAEWANRIQNTERFCVAISLLTCIPGMLGSNPSQDTGYPDIIRGFPQSL
jgi:hypothetical protein